MVLGSASADIECPASTRLLLIRHAQTVGTRHYLMAGRTDVPLSPLGRRQARELASAVEPYPIVAIYQSPLGRARETAAALMKRRGEIPLRTCNDLRELDLGVADGLDALEAYRRWPRCLSRALDATTNDFAFFGGEWWSEGEARAEKAIAAIVGAHPAETVGVVTHGAVLGLLLTRWLDQPRGSWRLHQPAPGSLSIAIAWPAEGGPTVQLEAFSATAFWSRAVRAAVRLPTRLPHRSLTPPRRPVRYTLEQSVCETK